MRRILPGSPGVTGDQNVMLSSPKHLMFPDRQEMAQRRSVSTSHLSPLAPHLSPHFGRVPECCTCSIRGRSIPGFAVALSSAPLRTSPCGRTLHAPHAASQLAGPKSQGRLGFRPKRPNGFGRQASRKCIFPPSLPSAKPSQLS